MGQYDKGRITRRTMLRWGATAAAAGPALTAAGEARAATSGGAGHFEFDEATIAQLQARMEAGLTSRALVRAYLRRIERIDRRGPTLRSVIETNPDAEKIAAALDDERRHKGSRGPLHGIPILLKDNIDTADRSPSSACMVVGIKPTVGLTSRAGVIPIAHSQDTVGPICRTVAGAATVLGALVGVDPRDPATADSRGRFHTDYRPPTRCGAPASASRGRSTSATARRRTRLPSRRARRAASPSSDQVA